jgi:hypothetical protein
MSAKKFSEAGKREWITHEKRHSQASPPKWIFPSGPKNSWQRFGAAVRHIIRHNPDLLAKGAE